MSGFQLRHHQLPHINRFGNDRIEFLHVPREGGAAFGAETAVNTDVFVLRHDPSGLL